MIAHIASSQDLIVSINQDHLECATCTITKNQEDLTDGGEEVAETPSGI